MSDATGFSINGAQLGALAARLNQSVATTTAKVVAVTQHHGVLLQAAVKVRARGRPGPRSQTGDYNRSIGLEITTAASGPEARVGSSKVQGPRLEHGFRGTDSLGRSYDQAALPHFGPGFDEVAPKYEAAIATVGGEVLGS